MELPALARAVAVSPWVWLLYVLAFLLWLWLAVRQLVLEFLLPQVLLVREPHVWRWSCGWLLWRGKNDYIRFGWQRGQQSARFGPTEERITVTASVVTASATVTSVASSDAERSPSEVWQLERPDGLTINGFDLW